MVHLLSAVLSTLFLLSGVIHAQKLAATKFAVTGTVIGSPSARLFMFGSGSIQILNTNGTPASPEGFNIWGSGFNLGTVPPFIKNVDPLSDFAAISYVSPFNNESIYSAFYQTVTGDIRSVSTLASGGSVWQNDTVPIALGVPKGTPIAAFEVLNPQEQLAIVVQYGDANGLLTQRFTTGPTSAGNWSDPIFV